MNVVNTDITGKAQFRERGGNNLKTVSLANSYLRRMETKDLALCACQGRDSVFISITRMTMTRWNGGGGLVI
jgi:hypothetical protein